MSRFYKIIVVLLIVLLFTVSTSFATGIDMNISDENVSSTSSVTTQENNIDGQLDQTNDISRGMSDPFSPYNPDEFETDTDTDTLDTTEATQTSTDYTSISSIRQSNSNDDALSTGNIINIFLIVIGVVLILLAIAILIRLRRS